MNAIQLLKFMGEVGARYTPQDLKAIERYFRKMIADNRVYIISELGIPVAICAFSITPYEKIEKFHDKETWKYLKHYPFNKICYIEKLIAKKWNREMRNRLEEMIISAYPYVEIGGWHRARKSGEQLIGVKVKCTTLKS